MKKPLDDAALDALFRNARSYNRWSSEAVPEATLRELYDVNDEHCYEKVPFLFPYKPEIAELFKDPVRGKAHVTRNATLQGAYLILAARALGLDCGPMSGFSNDKVDSAFFAGTSIKSNFLCALGVGTTEMLYPRSPRLPFEEACRLV